LEAGHISFILQAFLNKEGNTHEFTSKKSTKSYVHDKRKIRDLLLSPRERERKRKREKKKKTRQLKKRRKQRTSSNVIRKRKLK
jgi:hypothetical protein